MIPIRHLPTEDPSLFRHENEPNHELLNSSQHSPVPQSKSGKDEESSINYDRCIQEPLGQFGRYSVFVLVAAVLSSLIAFASRLNLTFNHQMPTWTCMAAPWRENSSASDSFVFLFNSTSLDNDCNCPPDHRYYSNVANFLSIRRTLGLICEHEYDYSIMASLMMCGGIMGSAVFGHVADRFGRKPCLIFGTVVCIAANVGFSFSSNFAIACVTEVLIGFCCAGVSTVSRTFLLEFIGRDYRLLTTCLYMGSGLGCIYAAGTGYVFDDWRNYQRAIGASQILVLFMWSISSESPRWLIQMNKLDKARKVITKIARVNRKSSPLTNSSQINGGHMADVNTYGAMAELLEKRDSATVLAAQKDILYALYQQANKKRIEQRQKKNYYTYLDLFKHRQLRLYTFIMVTMWFSKTLVNWMVLLRLGSLGGLVYVNLVVAGFIKLTARQLPLIGNNRIGRRPLYFVAKFIVAVSCIATIIVISTQPPGEKSLETVSTLCIFVGLSMSVVVNQLLVSETFPTVVRAQASGLASIASRAGNVLAPQIDHLGIYYAPAPFIFVTILVFAELIVTYTGLPDGKGKPLLDNLPPPRKR